MSVTSQVTDFSDMVVDLQNRVREQTGVTATQNIAKRYINIALYDMHIGFGEKFPWAERIATLITQPDYTTGTVTITQGSTSLTGSGTSWATNNAFGVNNARTSGRIVIDSGTEPYRIASVDSDTGITLASRFTQSDVSAGTYSYFEDEYDLASDFLRPIDFNFFDRNRDIPLISRREFRMRFPRNKTTGKMVAATIVDRTFGSDTTPVRRVRFHKPPDEAYTIDYTYVTSNLAVDASGNEQAQLSADTDEPIVPLPYRHVIVLHALYHHYRDIKDDQKSREVRQEYSDLMARIVGDQEVGSDRPRLQPRLGAYTRKARRPWSGRRATRFTTGDAFDEIR